MSRVIWDTVGEKFYETGVDHCVLYVMDDAGTYPKGVVWNGITSVSDKPTGGEPESIYSDNIKYLSLSSVEEMEGTIEAYTYPDEFMECDGSASPEEGVGIGQQSRKIFGLCYRTVIGNDTLGNEYGYKIHLVYGCLASPSEKTYQTINDSPEISTFSWDYKATSVPVEGFMPTAILTINTNQVNEVDLANLYDALYGTDDVLGADGVTVITPGTDPYLPLPDDVIMMFTRKMVGGKIFYIDETATGAKYTFYSRTGKILTDVRVGDEPYAYSVTGTPSKDRYYVFNANAVNSKTWSYQADGSWVYNLLGTEDGIGKGKPNTALVMAADDGAYVDWTKSIWHSLKALNDSADKRCDDWFVPSKAEVEAIRTATDRDGNSLTTLFSNTYIWSSYEFDATNAWYWHRTNQIWRNNLNKDSTSALLAARGF